PGKEHWEAVKWILRYLRGTAKRSLCFGNENLKLIGYSDSDMAGDVDSRKSTSGYLITFAGGAVSWQSKLQKCVTLSTVEAEKELKIEKIHTELNWSDMMTKSMSTKKVEDCCQGAGVVVPPN
ncbi:hypothetical protein CR513_61632, partial [Mucuna pruriens]